MSDAERARREMARVLVTALEAANEDLTAARSATISCSSFVMPSLRSLKARICEAQSLICVSELTSSRWMCSAASPTRARRSSFSDDSSSTLSLPQLDSFRTASSCCVRACAGERGVR